VHGTADSPESIWLGGAVSTSPLTASTDIASYLPAEKTVPAWLLVHGSADLTVPLGQSQELAAALQQRGAPVTLIVVPGAGHLDPVIDQTETQPSINYLKQVFGM
jgi:predicted esterase